MKINMNCTQQAHELSAYFSKQWLAKRLNIDARTLINKFTGSSEWTLKEANTIDSYHNILKAFVKLDNSVLK